MVGILLLQVPRIRMLPSECDGIGSRTNKLILYRIWAVYNQQLYDLTDYVYTLGLDQISGSYAFLDNDFISVFQRRSGQDITQPLNSVLSSMNTTYREAHMACIENVFAPPFKSVRKFVEEKLLLLVRPPNPSHDQRRLVSNSLLVVSTVY